MTQEKEKVWWMEDAYWFNDGAARFPKVASIVTEAERRGRVAAWEEAPAWFADHYWDSLSGIKDMILFHINTSIAAKLTELKKV